MKKMLAAILCTLLLAGMAYAEDITVPVSVTIQAPFTYAASTDVAFGTLYSSASATSVKMDASAVAATAAPTDDTGLVFTDSTGTITPGGSPIPGSIAVTTAADGVTMVATFDAATTAAMNTGFAGSSTIDITGLTSNITAVNTAAASAGTYYLAVGPILSIPADCSAGSYTGTLGFSLVAQ